MMSGDRATSTNNNDLLTDLLKAVSRSFYLTLRILPAPVRRPISIAYLLARTSDTIADTDVLPAHVRLKSLEALRQAIMAETDELCRFDEFISHQNRNKERELLLRINESINQLDTVDEEDRRLIRDVLEIIIGGQRLDLERFQDASSEQVICLSQASETDDYTYRVAGCVGEFWTRICFKHLAPNSQTPSKELVEQGIRFGKGLQLVNILRDLAEDHQQGRCYLPADRLSQAGINPSNLTDPKNEAALSTVYEEYENIARAHLTEGWNYTNSLSWKWIRIRLACAWPILLGFKTLELLPTKTPLDASKRAKVSRRDVKMTVLKTILAYPFPPIWNRLAGNVIARQTSQTNEK